MPGNWQSDTTNQGFLGISAIRGECWRREQGVERNRSAKICYREVGSRLRVYRQRHWHGAAHKMRGYPACPEAGRASARGLWGIRHQRRLSYTAILYNKHGHRKLLSMEIDGRARTVKSADQYPCVGKVVEVIRTDTLAAG